MITVGSSFPFGSLIGDSPVVELARPGSRMHGAGTFAVPAVGLTCVERSRERARQKLKVDL